MKTEFRKKDGKVIFEHTSDLEDFKNQSGEKIGERQNVQTVWFDNADKAIDMLEGNLGHVKNELEKFTAQHNKIDLDLTPFAEFGEFVRRNKDKVPIHRFKKLESLAELYNTKQTASKMMKYYEEEITKIDKQLDEIKRLKEE